MVNLSNIQKMMKEAQKMQEKLTQELEEIEEEASVGGGMVTIRMNGHKKVLSITINKEVINPDDPEMLQDLILSAFNETDRKVQEKIHEKLGGLTRGLGIPGLPGIPGFF
ncbi:MAG: YbaB/EbfC family nucleoid-associated protein [Acidobacteriota bacterium]